MTYASQESVAETLTQGEAAVPALPPSQPHRCQPIDTLVTPKKVVVLGLPDRRIVKGWMATHIMGRRTFWRVADPEAAHGLRVRLIEPEPVWWMPCESDGGVP